MRPRLFPTIFNRQALTLQRLSRRACEKKKKRRSRVSLCLPFTTLLSLSLYLRPPPPISPNLTLITQYRMTLPWHTTTVVVDPSSPPSPPPLPPLFGLVTISLNAASILAPSFQNVCSDGFHRLDGGIGWIGAPSRAVELWWC